MRPGTATANNNPFTFGNKNRKTFKLVRRNYVLYVFLIPALTYIILFHYWPIYGIQIAFRNFRPSLGIWHSPWVGTKYFKQFFASPRFILLIRNTVTVSFYGLIAGFPAPIILALLLNYTPNITLKKITQTVTYAPHFISMVVMVGMMSSFLSPRSGFINTFIQMAGGKAIFFFGEPGWFRHIYVWSGIWQGAGWGSIIYLASLSGVSKELHEAAIIDGAHIIQRIINIDIPSIMPTMVILLILNAGRIMNVGFEKIFLMQNSLNLNVSEVISTYTYKMGLLNAEFGYSSAIGLFNNIINFAILLLVNKLARMLSGASLW